MKKKRVVVAGFMTTCPIAGVVWQHLHYILGLKALGYDPIYIEDTARLPYDPHTFEMGETAVRNVVGITRRLADRFGFRWCYRARFMEPMKVFGDLTERQISQTFANAAATLNICGAQELHDDVLKSPCLAYVESDPGVEQIKLDKKTQDTIDYLRQHHAHFTFGENIGQSDCPLPAGGFKWHATRQPVALELWKQHQPIIDKRRATSLIVPKGAKTAPIRLTTIANWETKGKDVVWKNKIYYWSKTFEFLKFTDLPTCLKNGNFICEMATDMSRDPASRELYERQGWRLASPHELSRNYDAYIKYIQNSDAEWTVAKDQYIRLKTGWFSDRSACYLAAGRPVITQDTLFGKFIPTGEGLFAFRNMSDIQSAAETIAADYEKHSRKAIEIAREYFSAEKVVGHMLKTLAI
ncbi:MAG: hypothetical protein PHV34_15535 [Verrucomicrobiae bacterium]|nr:hypothetical protein [Verrucomicrobiae bacterium]